MKRLLSQRVGEFIKKFPKTAERLRERVELVGSAKLVRVCKDQLTFNGQGKIFKTISGKFPERGLYPADLNVKERSPGMYFIYDVNPDPVTYPPPLLAVLVVGGIQKSISVGRECLLMFAN